MSRTLAMMLLMVGTSAFPALAQNATATPPGVDSLIALERSWNAAFYRKDVLAIANILADEFVATYDDGRRGDRGTELAAVVDFHQDVLSAIQDDFTVKVYGETAVVWFTLNLTGLRDGERADVQFRFTDVFVWRDERWQCVSSQSTRVGAR